jgi:hypothetical protein
MSAAIHDARRAALRAPAALRARRTPLGSAASALNGARSTRFGGTRASRRAAGLFRHDAFSFVADAIAFAIDVTRAAGAGRRDVAATTEDEPR